MSEAGMCVLAIASRAPSNGSETRPGGVGVHVVHPGAAQIFGIDAILFLEDGGDHQLLALDAILGGAGLAHPVLLAVVRIGQEPVEQAVFPLDAFIGPAFDRRPHGRADVAAGDAAEELLPQGKGAPGGAILSHGPKPQDSGERDTSCGQQAASKKRPATQFWGALGWFHGLSFGHAPPPAQASIFVAGARRAGRLHCSSHSITMSMHCNRRRCLRKSALTASVRTLAFGPDLRLSDDFKLARAALDQAQVRERPWRG